MTDSPASIGVLLLEDDDLDVELIHEQLLQSGLSVDMRRAQTERDFVQELNRSGLRIVLSDFALPEYDGFAALSMAQRLQPDVPFIFVSGAIGEERAIETL
ncbi:MAG TPA: response regulator, partial [Polyangiaceae bacterium]